MITLQPINETNFMEAAALKVSDSQRDFVASAPMILARAYAYREQNAICWGICEGLKLVGLAMIHDMEEDPACYHLCEFLIDEKYQNRGAGQKALQLILNHCRRERKFRRVEVCVKKTDTAAVHVYQKAGFIDSGYQNPDAPDSQCMVCDISFVEIRYRDIVLRDMVESDIEDWIRWETIATEWKDWDGPDLDSGEPFDADAFRTESMETLNHQWDSKFRYFFELDTADGTHIGMVSSYATGADFQHIGSWKKAEEQGEFWHTLGIVICESRNWCRGLGAQALTAFCRQYLDHGFTNIRLQTWSGNIRMVRCAEKIGFREVNRFAGNRHIRGGVYDGLTFQLDLDRFHKYLKDNP